MVLLLQQAMTWWKLQWKSKKIYILYIKNQNKKDSKELSDIIASKLSIGSNEASSYIPILGKDGITGVLSDLGYEKKEITKLIKTIWTYKCTNF